MRDLQENTERDAGTWAKSSLFVCLIAITIASNTALSFTLLATLSWAERLTVVFAVAALTGGAVYTVLEMVRLGKQSR